MAPRPCQEIGYFVRFQGSAAPPRSTSPVLWRWASSLAAPSMKTQGNEGIRAPHPIRVRDLRIRNCRREPAERSEMIWPTIAACSKGCSTRGGRVQASPRGVPIYARGSHEENPQRTPHLNGVTLVLEIEVVATQSGEGWLVGSQTQTGVGGTWPRRSHEPSSGA